MDIARALGVGIIAVLEVLGWLMALGGTGQLHRDCADRFSNDGCRDEFRSTWWSVFLQFLVLLGVLILVVANGLEKFRIPLVAFVVLSTVRTMEEAEAALTLRDQNSRFVSDSAADSAAGGFVLMSMINFLVIAVVGSTGVPDVNLQQMNNRLRELLARRQETPAPAADGATAPAPAPAPPPQAVGYPKHDGFNPQPPQPTFDYTQQQQQAYPPPPPPPTGGAAPHV
ncbi:hypothetical protein BSKO_10303 [Bryopsis sp. KO-2023]|nr:hypothetical protein BSKO_10303 [Bryopsis sp. KO-2023]